MMHSAGRSSSLRLRSASLSALVLTGVLASAVLTAAPGSAADPYPSWEDIQQAKSSETAKAAEADKLEGLISDLREEAGTLGDAAVEATNRYNAARDALAASDKELALLAAQREEAAEHSTELKRQVAGLAAQTYKSGGAAMTLVLLDTEASADALHGADLMDRVSSRAGTLYAEAVASEKVAAGFGAQEQEARDARAELAAEAEEALQEGRASAAAADKAIQDEEARKSVLLAQLADLHGSTAAAEEARLRGIAAEKAFEDQQAAAERAAAEEPAPAGQQPAGWPAGNAPPTGTKPPTAAPPAPAPVPAPAPAPAPVPAPAPAPAPVPAPAPAPVPPGSPAPARPVDDPAGAQNYASGRMGAYGWDANEFRCLVVLWNHESGWLTSADNPYSDAYGIPQSLPGSNMSSHGSDWQTNYRTQINWGLDYVRSRYGTPCDAYGFWQRNNWY